MKIWFTSDTHFGHKNIIKYCNRPFASAAEMDDKLVEAWNKIVKNDDIVWHLGDFAFGSSEYVSRIFKKLHGQINLVMGNHDHHKLSFYYDIGFHRVYDRPVIIQDFWILSHAPLQWVKSGLPYVNLFGHVHDQEMYKTVTSNSVCCCVERWNYTPVSFDKIREEVAACQ